MRIILNLLVLVGLGLSTSAFAATHDYKKLLQQAYEAEENEEYQKAADMLLSAIPQIPRDSVDDFCDIYSNLSVAFLRLGNYDSALEYGKKCLELDEQSGIEENISISLNNLAGICLTVKRYTLAEEYLKKGIESEERLKRDDKLAVRLGMLCEVYTQQKRIDEAIPLARRAMELDRKGGREDKMAIRLAQLGNALVLGKQLKEAESYLDEAYTLLTKYENYSSLCITDLALGQVKRGLGKRAEAEKYLKEAVEITRKIGQRTQLKDAYMELSRLYGEGKDYEKACHYLKAYTLLSDSLQQEDVQQQISDLQVRYETGQKELELTRQKAIIQRQQLISIGVSALVVILLTALVFVYISLRLKKRTLRLRDELMRIISHDLKNPALASQQSLHLLNKHFSALSTEELHDEVKQLSENADAQVELLLNLLTWAQLQTDRLAFQPIDMDLNSVVEKVVSQHSNQAAVKNITINVDTPQPTIVKADRQMVAIVLRNILSNAIKFSPSGSTVEVGTDGGSLYVSDHGVGMDSEKASTLGTAGEEGSGVGMGLVRTLIKKNHGTIDIESEVGKGTRVTATFPMA